MSTPELRPETPITDAMVAAYRKEGLETYASTCAAIALARKLESALNAAREAIENAPHDIGCDGECTLFIGRVSEGCTCWKAEALAQIDKALSPQQSKTT